MRLLGFILGIALGLALLAMAGCHADPTGPVAHRTITIPGEEVRQ